MSTTDYIELGKRLVASKHFKWMPGMLCQRRLHTGEWVPVRLMEAAYNATVIDYNFIERNAVPSMNHSAARMMGEGYITMIGWVLADDLLPDLSDASTLGCLLSLYEESREMLTVPDPVYTYVSAYGLRHEKTLEEIVKRLETASCH